MTINGSAAAQTLLGFGEGIDRGMCLYYVWQAYKAQGARTDRSAPTATLGWERSDGQHPGDRNPPPGVPVWWGSRYDGNRDGDVVISLGDGRVVATDWPRWGVVGVTTLDEREAQIGREYLGWSESIFDARVYTPPTPEPEPTPTPEASEEDDMKLIRWNEGHVFAVGTETVYHVPNPGVLGQLTRVLGPYIDVDNDGLTAVAVANGLSWDAFDAVLRGIAPGSDGKYWSRLIAEGIAIRGNQMIAQKTLEDVLAAAEKATRAS